MRTLKRIGYGTEIRRLDAGPGRMKLTMVHSYEKEGFFASFARGILNFLRIRN